MPFYQQSEPGSLGATFREGLDDLRSAFFKLGHAKLSADQMTDEQFGEEFGYVADDAAAKAEMASGIGKLLNEDPNATSAQVNAAVMQMLNQFS